MLNEIPIAGLRERVLVLRAMPWAASLDEEGLYLLAEYARNCQFRANETLFSYEGTVTSIFIVVEGEVDVAVDGNPLTVVRPGHAVGITSLLARDPRKVDAIATKPTRALEIPAEALLAAYEENFSLVRNVLRLQCRGIMQQRGQLPVASTDGAGPAIPRRSGFLTLAERVFELRRTPLFKDANLDAVFEIARATVESRADAGTVLWRIGDPSLFWLRVEWGSVYCRNATGRAVGIQSPYVLGPIDCLAESPRSYGAVAATPLVLHRTDLASMLGIFEAHHDLAMDLIATMARTLLNLSTGLGGTETAAHEDSAHDI